MKCLILGLVVAAGLAAAAARPTEIADFTGAAAPCAAPEFRQFDFFAGDWDTYDVDSATKVVARNRVTIILGGCVLHEIYEGRDGLRGESYTIYDAARRVWHQSWVTNRGQLLLLDGGLRGDSMVLTGTDRAADGATSLLRGIWYRQAGAVRETALRSTDGGKTWRPVFDILFRPHGQSRNGRTR